MPMPELEKFPSEKRKQKRFLCSPKREKNGNFTCTEFNKETPRYLGREGTARHTGDNAGASAA